MKHFKTRIALLACLASLCALSLAPAAFGQGSSVEVYAGGGGGAQNEVEAGAGGGGGGTGEVDDGALPFTGLDIGLALGGAALLVGAGALVSRFAVRQPQA